MNDNILKRIQVLEHMKKEIEVPDLVFIETDQEHNKVIATEQYFKKDLKGNVVKGGGKEKKILLNSPEEYQVKKGFKGSIFYDEENIE